MSQHRTFTVVDISAVRGLPAGHPAKQFKGGKYKASTPVAAAKKVLTKVSAGVDKEVSLKVTIQEMGGRGKTYTYKVSKHRKEHPVAIKKDDVAILFRYTIHASSI